MASSSSSSPPIAHSKRYHVFPSFHGADVRRTFLSHLHSYFANKGIKTFKDQEIERGHSIGPELVNAIRGSRISLVLLSKNYASSSWCLDELLEILKCKEGMGQIVMTIFYDVDPSSVRKQKGDFGKAFKRSCQGKTEEVKQRWRKALTDVANIEGEHNWANEADMIQKVATDVSNKLSVTESRDFDDKVGLQAHLKKVKSLLCLERDDEVKMIGIWGPAGIGKSSIARALYNLLSSDFEHKCFMGNLGGVVSCRRVTGVDDYEKGLALQKQFLSKILKHEDMRVEHLGMVEEWLRDQRVLIILDDVDAIDKLDLLAKKSSWFGSGSRIVVTTQDKKIFEAHGIKDIYHVDFPSGEEALEMLCLSAFEQRSVPDGFEEVARKVAELCCNLPLALSVVGSSLRRQSKEEWEFQISRFESSIDNIQDVLRVGYDRLSENDQDLFLHIACILKDTGVPLVKSMLAESSLEVDYGLKTLVGRSLVQIPYHNGIEMHSLLVQMGRQIVRQQSKEPGKRQFLVDAKEIRHVLAKETGTGSVIGISLYMDKVGDFSISGRAFEGMPNLCFLNIYVGSLQLRVSEDLEYLPRLRSLHWDHYPRKRLPPEFQPESLVHLYMSFSNLEKLWDGVKPLPNLYYINLSFSIELKEIPNLSEASNLQHLILSDCTSLVELPSSIGNLHKLKTLDMSGCVKLRVIPTNINLASLVEVDMSGCSRLTTFPDFSSNIKLVDVSGTMIKDVPSSVAGRLSRDTEIILNDRNINETPDWFMMEEGESSSSKRKDRSEGGAEVSEDESVVKRSKKPRS